MRKINYFVNLLSANTDKCLCVTGFLSIRAFASSKAGISYNLVRSMGDSYPTIFFLRGMVIRF